MKRLTKKLICVVLIIVALLCLISIATSGYDIYTNYDFKQLNNVLLLQSENQSYLVGTNGNTIKIDAIYPESYSVEITVENNVYSYNICSGTLVAICPIKSLNQTQIVLYNISTDIMTTFSITGTNHFESTQIAYSNGYVYLSYDDGKAVKYNTRGQYITSYIIDTTPCFLMIDENNNVYATANRKIMNLNSGSTMNTSSQFTGPATFACNDIMIDNSGYIYKINSNSAVNTTDYKSGVTYPSGGVINNQVIITQTNTIKAVDISSGMIKKSLTLSTSIEQLYTCDDMIVAFTYQSGTPTVSLIPYSELNTVTENSSTTNNSTSKINTISSNTYTVDKTNLKITGIAHETTVSEFKKNINYDGFNVKFTNYNGKSFTSGNVGTATTAIFYNDDVSIEYELSVIGDLTGEGNVNSRDKNLMFDYLLENVSFSGVYISSADLDNSSNIDIVDLVLLLRLIESS